MLAANAITKRFGRTLALDGVDFCAREGEIHALVGENGAGKSTLINIFAGRLRPDYGRVALNGAVLGAGSAAAGATGAPASAAFACAVAQCSSHRLPLAPRGLRHFSKVQIL